MAASLGSSLSRRAPSLARLSCRHTILARPTQRRTFQTQISKGNRPPSFAFAFDIDGVLVRSSTPIPGASETLAYLQSENIPFILLTNGGGKSEQERVADLTSKLNIPLDMSMFVQSHTPFADMHHYKGADKTVLVVGGDADKCARVAREHYGFTNVVTPGDILCAEPDVWPFAKVFEEYYRPFAHPLPAPIYRPSPKSSTSTSTTSLAKSLKIDAIFVYNDPRDWGLDATIMLDLLLSSSGHLGTLSPKNGNRTLPNRGYQQDSQPPIFYSNPDLWWASSHPLPRLGQGGFQAAFAGLWHTATHGAELLNTTLIGKPHHLTYEFAEKRLRAHRKAMFAAGGGGTGGVVGLNDPLRRVYMVGDNPESDIRGAMGYKSPFGSVWKSVLVKTGVYKEGDEVEVKPSIVLEDVREAVRWAVDDASKNA